MALTQLLQPHPKPRTIHLIDFIALSQLIDRFSQQPHSRIRGGQRGGGGLQDVQMELKLQAIFGHSAL
jgi:hypothetical protein